MLINLLSAQRMFLSICCLDLKSWCLRVPFEWAVEHTLQQSYLAWSLALPLIGYTLFLTLRLFDGRRTMAIQRIHL